MRRGTLRQGQGQQKGRVGCHGDVVMTDAHDIPPLYLYPHNAANEPLTWL
jgi:hypothetical protein